MRSARAWWSSQQPRCTQISCARQPGSRDDRSRSTASAWSMKCPRPRAPCPRPLAAGVGHALVSSSHGGALPAHRRAGIEGGVVRRTSVERPATAVHPTGYGRDQGTGRSGRSQQGSEYVPASRRAADASPSAARPGPLRRLAAALADGLYRPLAGDDARVAYWLRHVRSGVLLSELSAFAVVGYVMITHSPGRHHPAILGLAALVIAGCPALLLLPLTAMMRDRRGPTLFYLWPSPPRAGHPGHAVRRRRLQPPRRTALPHAPLHGHHLSAVWRGRLGTVMTGGYLLFVELPGLTTSGLFFLA